MIARIPGILLESKSEYLAPWCSMKKKEMFRVADNCMNTLYILANWHRSRQIHVQQPRKNGPKALSTNNQEPPALDFLSQKST